MSAWQQTLERLAEVGPDFAVLLLAFTAAILVLLVFGVRVVLIVRKLPVPADLWDMAKPRSFRTLMLGFAVLLTPLVAWEFLPTEGMDRGWALLAAYVVAALIAAVAWLLLELFYRRRARRR